jgi:hypothetical protein
MLGTLSVHSAVRSVAASLSSTADRARSRWCRCHQAALIDGTSYVPTALLLLFGLDLCCPPCPLRLDLIMATLTPARAAPVSARP